VSCFAKFFAIFSLFIRFGSVGVSALRHVVRASFPNSIG
jgi:hypothetical protein